MGKHGSEYARSIERDHYPSPDWVVAALAEHVDLNGLLVWEPAAGNGAMVEALRCAGCARVYASDIVDYGNGRRMAQGARSRRLNRKGHLRGCPLRSPHRENQSSA
jgi:hypothetical protein